MVIWRLGVFDFLGPLYHSMSPNGALYKKPKLITLVAFFSYLRLAYVDGNLAEDIKAAMADKVMKQQCRHHLMNLRSVMEFYIPAVLMINDTCFVSTCNFDTSVLPS